MGIFNTSNEQLNEELLLLARSRIIDEGKLDPSLNLITESMAKGLEVERINVWFFGQDGTYLICQNLYLKQSHTHSKGTELRAKDFPAYFKHLAEERVLCAADAETDPETSELVESYLKPFNIKSMLDAPIRASGKMVGAVCAESVGEKRDWTEHEQNFVGNIADVIARAIQANKKTDALTELEKINANLEQIIKERTHELEIQQLNSQYSSKMASLGRMASSIAHEINNPLTVIIGSAEILNNLIKSNEINPEEISNFLDKIIKTSKRISKIIKGLRHFSRDAQNDPMEVVAVSQILEDAYTLCKETYIAHDSNLSFEVIPPDLKIKCQSITITQVIINLLNNALDAVIEMPEKWVKVEAREIGGLTEIRVTDSGKGIPQHLHENIFAPFFTTKPPGSGTGLGLAIAQGILHKHGGQIVIDNKLSNTCFVITLPKP